MGATRGFADHGSSSPTLCEKPKLSMRPSLCVSGCRPAKGRCEKVGGSRRERNLSEPGERVLHAASELI